MEGTKPELLFENLWKKNEEAIHSKIRQLWKRNFPDMPEQTITERLQQVVFAITTPSGNFVGVSTAYKAYLDHLKHNYYAFRCFIEPAYRMPGLTTKLIVKTRDWLEEIYQEDGEEKDRCIGMVTLVENERIMKVRNEAIWRGSGMVYIGNSATGKHIRAYYFKKALI